MPKSRAALLLFAIALSNGCAMFGPPVVPAANREQHINRSLYTAGRALDESRLQRILEDDPENVAALLQLADRLRRAGEMESARELIDRARKIAPESSLVRVRYAESLADRGSTLAARWEVER